MTFYDEKDKSEKTVLVPIGENLLEAAHSNDIDLEGLIPAAICIMYRASLSCNQSWTLVCTRLNNLLVLWRLERSCSGSFHAC